MMFQTGHSLYYNNILHVHALFLHKLRMGKTQIHMYSLGLVTPVIYLLVGIVIKSGL